MTNEEIVQKISKVLDKLCDSSGTRATRLVFKRRAMKLIAQISAQVPSPQVKSPSQPAHRECLVRMNQARKFEGNTGHHATVMTEGESEKADKAGKTGGR